MVTRSIQASDQLAAGVPAGGKTAPVRFAAKNTSGPGARRESSLFLRRITRSQRPRQARREQDRARRNRLQIPSVRSATSTLIAINAPSRWSAKAALTPLTCASRPMPGTEQAVFDELRSRTSRCATSSRASQGLQRPCAVPRRVGRARRARRQRPAGPRAGSSPSFDECTTRRSPATPVTTAADAAQTAAIRPRRLRGVDVAGSADEPAADVTATRAKPKPASAPAGAAGVARRVTRAADSGSPGAVNLSSAWWRTSDHARNERSSPSCSPTSPATRRWPRASTRRKSSARFWPWTTELRLIVENHGGTVPQVMGDGFMAVFACPPATRTTRSAPCRAGLAFARYAEREAVAPGRRPLSRPAHRHQHRRGHRRRLARAVGLRRSSAIPSTCPPGSPRSPNRATSSSVTRRAS